MATNNPNATYEIGITQRQPIVGDVAEQYDAKTCSYRYAIYDGQAWKEMNTNSLGAPYLTAAAAQKINGGHHITSNGTNIATLGTVRNNPEDFKEDFFAFMKDNLRVAEYVDDNGKIEYVQLQFRTGPGYVWEEVKRVKVKPTDKPY